MHLSLVGWALALVAVVAAACAAPGPTPSAAAPDAEGGGGLAEDFEDFDLVAYQGEDLLGGREVTFSQSFAHGQPVVLNFWAGACPPCRAEMPWFQNIADEFEGRAVIVGVDIGPFVGLGSHDDARRLLDDLDIRYPTAYAVDAASVRLYTVRSMPTTIFFDSNGGIVERHDGLLLEEQLRDKVGRLAASG